MKRRIAVFVLAALTLNAQTSPEDSISKAFQEGSRLIDAQTKIIEKCLAWIGDSATRHPEDINSVMELQRAIEKIMRDKDRVKK